MAAAATPPVDSLTGIAACAQSMVRLCVSDPDRFHRQMADELRLTLFGPVPGKPGEVISTLFRPTAEFDLEVEMWASVNGQQQVAVYFDGFKVAWCNSNVAPATPTAGTKGGRMGTDEAAPWAVDQDEAAQWALGVGQAPDDVAGAMREIEAGARVALEHLAELVRYAQSDRGAG